MKTISNYDLNGLANDCYQNARVHGFWDSFDTAIGRVDDACGKSHEFSEVRLAFLGQKLALIHSELSEALEALRRGTRPDEHCPEFTNVEIEMADAIIRILDLCASEHWDIGGAILAKMTFNETRPPKHGKAF